MYLIATNWWLVWTGQQGKPKKHVLNRIFSTHGFHLIYLIFSILYYKCLVLCACMIENQCSQQLFSSERWEKKESIIPLNSLLWSVPGDTQSVQLSIIGKLNQNQTPSLPRLLMIQSATVWSQDVPVNSGWSGGWFAWHFPWRDCSQSQWRHQLQNHQSGKVQYSAFSIVNYKKSYSIMFILSGESE